MTSTCPGSPVLVLGLVLATVGGCTNADEPAVREVAASFGGADADGRCRLLAPTTVTALERDESSSCSEAIGQLSVGSGEVVSVQVWGPDALVRLTDDTLFLTRGDTGWQVSAAACAPDGDGRYVCQLEGS
jgi:hypothetical protein